MTTLCFNTTVFPRKRRDMRDLCLQGMCLLTILRAAKGMVIAPLRNQKREKAASLPKISINIFDISKEGVGGGGSREKRTNDVPCG